jgi:hypothetical protein
MKYIKPETTIIKAEHEDLLSCSCGCSSVDPTHVGCNGCEHCNHPNRPDHECKSKE